MENFKKLLQSFICLLLVLIIVFFVNYQIINKYRESYLNSYLASVIDKEQLLRDTPSPKIILIGGSNVAFGLDSDLISEKTGMPVVNVGIQGGLGINFILNFVKPYIREGDILIISPEYHILLDSLHSGEILTDLLILYPKGFENLSTLREYWEVFKDFPAVYTGLVKRELEIQITRSATLAPMVQNEKIYFREAFDPETGDIMTNVDSNSSYQEALVLDFNIPNPDLSENIQLLNEYEKFVESKNAKAFFLFPATAQIEDDQTRQILTTLTILLKNNLSMPVLSSWGESYFTPEMMFDTEYHLNNSGRTIHTNNFIMHLCEADTALSCK